MAKTSGVKVRVCRGLEQLHIALYILTSVSYFYINRGKSDNMIVNIYVDYKIFVFFSFMRKKISKITYFSDTFERVESLQSNSITYYMLFL